MNQNKKWRKWMLLLFDGILSRSLLFFLVTLNVNFVWSPDILFDLGNFDPLSGEYMQSGVVCGGSWGIQKNLFPSLSFSRWFPHCEVSFFWKHFYILNLGVFKRIFLHTWYLSFFTLAKFLENKIYTEKRQFFELNL